MFYILVIYYKYCKEYMEKENPKQYVAMCRIKGIIYTEATTRY